MWITCPLWLDRWSRWLASSEDATAIEQISQQCRIHFQSQEQTKSAISSFPPTQVYLQTALLSEREIVMLDFAPIRSQLNTLTQQSGIIAQLLNKILVLTDEDCLALVETGLQREVRVMLKEDSKTVKGGSFRSEEAIPPETVMFVPWGMKPFNPGVAVGVDEESDTPRSTVHNQQVKDHLLNSLRGRLQLGGLESLGRGWVQITTASHQAQTEQGAQQ
jgi:CRISPR-associated protein Cmr4